VIPTTISSPKNFTHEEQEDDIDIVHIRPLNNLSPFNFDYQQMNASRHNNIHTDLSHRNTYSPEITTNRILNLSDSQSPAQQSFTSDISALDDISTQSKQKKTLPNFFRSNHDMEVSIKQALTTSVNNLLLIFLFIFSLFSDIKS
jgi:hypothetical protein